MDCPRQAAHGKAVSAPRPQDPALLTAAQACKAYDYLSSLPQGLTRGDEREATHLFTWEGVPVAQVPAVHTRKEEEDREEGRRAMEVWTLAYFV